MRFISPAATRVATVLMLSAALAACATKKAPPPPVTAQQTPPPAQETPRPPVQQPSQPQRSEPLPPPPQGAVPGSQQDFVVNVGDRVYFDTDSNDVRADARPILDAQAAWLAKYWQVNIRIEGNADERGTREYNFALGARRANAVKEYLISKGVAGSRIETVSYGKERPIDGGADEAAWAKNRNGHTSLVSGAR